MVELLGLLALGACEGAWGEVRASGLAHVEARTGPQEAAWPLGTARFPELIATRHRVGELPVWVTVTTGLSAQRMAGVEQYVDEPDKASRVELAIARTVPDQAGAELLSSLAVIPFGRCTWLGEGHTIGGSPGNYPAFGADRAAVLLTATPPAGSRYPRPTCPVCSGAGQLVTYLWVMVIDEETFRLARGRGVGAPAGQRRHLGPVAGPVAQSTDTDRWSSLACARWSRSLGVLPLGTATPPLTM